MKILMAMITAIIGFGIFGAFLYAAILLEKQSFNNCRCIGCNYPLRHFGNDSKGGRGYICDRCGYKTWVSWYSIDKDYRKDI